jgi:hypothetical protein
MPGARVTLVTAEGEPLEAFGAPAGRMVREELEIDGVHLVTGTRAVAQSRMRLAFESGTGLDVDRIVHLPRLVGPGIAGVPCDSSGFLLAGDDGAVPGADGIYAVGDGTATPIKQGGLAAQQAEAAAYAIAARAGADVERPPVRPVLRGVLRTRRGLRYMVAEPPGGAGAVEISSHSLWWPPTKVASSWLMPWLTTRDAHRGAPSRPAARSPGEPHGIFRRTVGAGRTVTFDARASGGTGWRVAPADHGVGEPMTLADALALLPGEEHAAALAVHAAALDATCALIATLHGDARTIHDSQRLGRLARLAGRARALAAELGAVRREASPWVEPRGRATMV